MLAMKSAAEISSAATISNGRVAREASQLQANQKHGTLPDAVHFQVDCIDSEENELRDSECFTICILPEAFGGKDSVVLRFAMHYKSYPFSPPTVLCTSGLNAFPKEIQKMTIANSGHNLVYHILDDQWTPAMTISRFIHLLVKELKGWNYPKVEGKLPVEASENRPSADRFSENFSQPVCFTINDVISPDDIPGATLIKCDVNVGGQRFPRSVAINPHSIFILEMHSTEPGKVIVRSQRSLLEIARVSYTLGKAVRVVYKASQGGDSCTFLTDSPEACVAAIRQSLSKLGIQGNETPTGKNPEPDESTRKIKRLNSRHRRESRL